MSGVGYWEGLLADEIKEIRQVLAGVRKTKTAHVLSSVCIVERRFGTAFEIKKSFREELDKLCGNSGSKVVKRQYMNRLQELDQQLLALQINWDIMSNEEPPIHKKKDIVDDADSTSTGWTAWTNWTSPSVSSQTTSGESKTKKKNKKRKKSSKRKSATTNTTTTKSMTNHYA